MKLYFLLFIIFSFCINHKIKAQVDMQDSLALVDLYNNTAGPGWTNNSGWLKGPVNNWYGVTLANDRVYLLELDGNNLTGSLPPSIGNLNYLVWLFFGGNKLTGQIPGTIGNLINLQWLTLNNNNFSLGIPASIGNLVNLWGLDLSNAQLTFIPATIGNLINLTQLDFSQNKLTNIPASMSNLTKLTWLNLSNNSFADTIPITISGMINLEDLYLDDNQFTGSIPATFGNLTKLKSLQVFNNKLSGIIPSSIGNLASLNDIEIANNNFSGPVPKFVSTAMHSMEIYHNAFTFDGMEQIARQYSFANYFGQAKISIQNTGNKLSVSAGGILANNTYQWYKNGSLLKTVVGDSTFNVTLGGNYYSIITNKIATALMLTSNTITMANPDSVVLVKLYNSTNGNNWTNNKNWLVAGQPISTWNGISVNPDGRVTSIGLPTNNLTGTIPEADSLGSLTALQTINISENAIGGVIPAGLGALVNLQVLVLSSNKFFGTLPAEFGKLQKLNYLFLQANNLSGPIPSSLINLGYILGINIGGNNFVFDGMEAFAQKFNGNPNIVYSPQNAVPLIITNNKLSVSVGGTLANNTYDWFNNGWLEATIIGDSNYIPMVNGPYSVIINNRNVGKLTLFSNLDTINNFGWVLAAGNTQSTQIINNSTLFYHENSIINTITPMGTFPVSGRITCKVTFDSKVQFTGSLQPYLQRHYDIEPASNASNATASITLYYTQAEFTAYNLEAQKMNLPLLPVDTVDAANNKANLRISQFHGTGTAPGNYSGYSGSGALSLIIIPTVIFNKTAARWEVSFTVKGFSGFYGSTSNVVLPINFMKFTAILDNKKGILNWIIAGGISNTGFEIERSYDGLAFEKIGFVNQNNALQLQFSFTDAQPLAGKNYYRLKQVDLTGRFSFSPVEVINNLGYDKRLTVYPNPAVNNLNFVSNGIKGPIEIMDITGRILKTIQITDNITSIFVGDLSGGNYLCKVGSICIMFLKQ